MRRSLVFSGIGLLALAGPFAIGYRLSQGDRATAPVAIPSVVDQVRDALAARYYRPVPSSVLHLGSVGEMISALRDPYTAYLAPVDYRLLRQQTASRYSGIGVSVLPSHGSLVIVALRPGPAERAGAHPGDRIVGIGGIPTKQLPVATSLGHILGPSGTHLGLDVLRGGRRLHLDVRRAVVRAPIVDAQLLSFAGRRFGDLRLSAFRVGAAVVLRREILALRHEGAAGLVLDLRQNPGGLLTEAVGVSSLFLERGVVVSVVGAHKPRHVYRTLGGVVTRLPLVVLVDRYSASSAEIVAAALRDHQRATLVGERTFGKALIQSIDPLDNGAALELTVARYYTPAGEDISGIGVVPQIRVVDDPASPHDEALAAALRVLARPTS